MKHKLTRLTSLLLAFIMTFSMLLVPVEAAEFSDVPNGSWYADAVDYVYERGWMVGVGDSTFAPNLEVTRGMFVTVLAKYAQADLSAVEPAFTDTPAGAWYTGPCAWAAEKGITAGAGDGLFLPNRSITRQDLVTILYRFIEKMGYSIPVGDPVSFNDLDQASAYAVDAVNFCASAGLVAGVGNGYFCPLDTATRSQLAVILRKLDTLVNGGTLPADPYPAQYFEEQPSDEMKVTVNAPLGALPEDTEMTVRPVNDEALLSAIASQYEGDVLGAVDISFSKDGEELEPESEVNVHVSMNGLDPFLQPVVVHMSDDGETEQVEGAKIVDTAENRKAVQFDSKNFSVYVILNQQVVEVNFYKGEEKINSQRVIKNGADIGSIYDPGVDLVEFEVFLGWAIGSPNGEQRPVEDETKADINDYIKANFNSLISSGLNIYAITSGVRYLVYVDEDGCVLKTDFAYTSNPKLTVDLDYVPKDGGNNHFGWKTTVNGQEVQYLIDDETEDEITLTENVTILEPIVKGGVWLSFDGNKGPVDNTPVTFTESQFVVTGETPTEPETNPDRVGYHFGGWYNTAACDEGDEFDFDAPMTVNKTAYAKWDPLTVNYRVVVWQQSRNDSMYDVDVLPDQNPDGLKLKSYNYYKPGLSSFEEVRSAKAGDTVYLKSSDKTLGGTESSDMGYFFTYNSNTSSENGAVVAGNGTTVLNAYYDRRIMTFNFRTALKQVNYDVTTDEYTRDGYSGYYFRDCYFNKNVKHYYNSTGTIEVELVCDDPEWITTSGGNEYVLVGFLYRRSSSSSYSYSAYSECPAYFKRKDNGATVTTVYGADVSSNATRTSPIWQTVQGLYDSQLPFWPMADGADWKYYDPEDTSEQRWITERDSFNMPNGKHTTTYDIYLNTYNPSDPFTIHWIQQDLNGAYTYERTSTLLGPGETQAYDNAKFIGFSAHGHNLITDSTSNYFQEFTAPETKFSYTTCDSYSYYNNYQVYVYYKRNQHQLIFMSNNVQVGTPKTVYFDKPLTEYKNTDPGTAPDGYYFAGWYADPGLSKKFDFSEKMPDANVTVYAKWSPMRFRVVIDPTGGDTSIGADEITFEDPNQSTTFRVTYGNPVEPGGIDSAQREGWQLAGWYTNTNFTHHYNFDDVVTNTTTGMDMSYADKPASERQGTAYPNTAYDDSGADYQDVRGRLYIYARWRHVMDAGEYIQVVYDCTSADNVTGTLNDEPVWTDTNHYADTAEAITLPAAKADMSGYTFKNWTLMKPTDPNDASTLTATDVVLNPGDTFNVLMDDAVVSTEDGHKVYTVYMQASYRTSTDTHITWVGNGGTTASGATYVNSPDAIMNTFINIMPADTFTRAGYMFLGWARLIERDYTNTDGTYKPYNGTDTWLTFAESGDYLYVDNSQQYHVSQVAANEQQPYHIMYAIWAPIGCYVYHSATGMLEAIPASVTKLNLQEKVTPGYLYGGYYSDMPILDDAAVESAKVKSGGYIKYMAPVEGAVKYDGSALRVGTVRFWNSDLAETANGTNLTGTALTGGKVYYLKEVPANYLVSKIEYIYNSKNQNKIVDMYLTTLVDDNLYDNIGFKHAGSDKITETTFARYEKLVNRFTFVPWTEEANAKTISAADFGMTRGYVAVKHFTDYAAAGSFTMVPTWTTKDGVEVCNNGLTITIGQTETKDDIQWRRNYDGTERLLLDFSKVKRENSNSASGYTCWLEGNALTKAYFVGPNNTTQWVTCSATTDDGVLSVVVPQGMWNSINFCRVNPNTPQETNWANFWNQTGNVKLVNDNGPCMGSTDNCIKEFLNNYMMMQGDYGGDLASQVTNVTWGTYLPLQVQVNP